MNIAYAFVACLLIYSTYMVRLIAILPFFKDNGRGKSTAFSSCDPLKSKHKDGGPLHLFLFLGSGGHTGEMLRILENYSKILLLDGNTIYIGYSDPKSRESVDKLIVKKYTNCHFKYYEFVKAREVNANVWQSLISILRTLMTSLRHVLEISRQMTTRPHLVLLNGPGTCCILALWFKAIEWVNLFQSSSNIVYVESLARINTLSLSGKILYWLADVFVVQWQELQKENTRARWYGILV